MTAPELRKLSLESLAYYPFPPNFTFIIGGVSYPCHLVQILPISGTIQQLFLNDKSISSYTFEHLKDPYNNFPLFIDFINGHTIDINDDNLILLYNIGLILDIPYLINGAGKLANCEINSENAVSFCQKYYDHGVDYEIPATFIAVNWDTFSGLESVMNLPVEILNTIIQIDGFKVSSETELFEWIENLVNTKGRQYIPLFGHVLFSRLRRHHIKHLIEILSKDTIDPFVWQELDDRLIMEINPDENLEPSDEKNIDANQKPESETSQMTNTQPYSTYGSALYSQNNFIPINLKEKANNEKEFADAYSEESLIDLSYEPGYRLNGVVTYIKNQLGPNYTDAVIATGGGTKIKKIGNIFDYDDTKKAWWDNFDLGINRCTKENAWCMIELRGYLLNLQSYTLASPANRISFHQPKSWRIEVSADGVNFETVHEVSKCPEMNVQYPILTFSLPKGETQPIRFIKLVMLENYASAQSSNQYELSLSAFELYGKLRQL